MDFLHVSHHDNGKQIPSHLMPDVTTIIPTQGVTETALHDLDYDAYSLLSG